jgi:DNA polymerase IV
MAEILCRDCCEFMPASGVGRGRSADMAGSAPGYCSRCGGERLVSHPELTALHIAHIDCDAFYASVEKRDRPAIRNQPLIVGHPGGRGVVTTACYIARTFGIRSAMPMFKALELCPDAVVIAPDMAKYKGVSAAIRTIMLAATSVIEPVSLDEAYLDLSDEWRTEAPPAAEALATIATRVEREVGITVSVGLSANKFLAKLASEMNKPRGFSVIGAGEAKALLAPLSVRKIHGVGEATARRLEASGVHSIGDLQAMTEMQLTTQYGRFGRRLATYAQGEDERAVTPARPTKSISAETTFSRDTGDRAELLATLGPLCARVAQALQRKALAGGTVVVKLKTADFRLLSRNRRLTVPTQRATTLLEQASLLVEKEANGQLFRLLGVGVDDLRPAVEADPPDLFG